MKHPKLTLSIYLLLISVIITNNGAQLVNAVSREKELANDKFQEIENDPDLSTVHLIEAHPFPEHRPIQKEKYYEAHVTLYILNREDDTRIKTGFDTRSSKSGRPYVFQLGKNLDPKGWNDGVGLMNEGERCEIKVPPNIGYGSKQVGYPDSKIQIPPNSWLIFDMHILRELNYIPKKLHKPKIIFVDDGDDNDDENEKTEEDDEDIEDETKREL